MKSKGLFINKSKKLAIIKVLVVSSLASMFTQNAIAVGVTSKDPDKLLTKITSIPANLIIEFDSTDIKNLVLQERLSSGLKFDNKTIKDQKRAFYKSTKDAVFANFTAADISRIKKYSLLPMAFVKVRDKAVLKRLLSNPKVKAVFENQIHSHSLAQSLPLINQPPALAAGHGGAGTTVAILDTGVDFTRAAFGSCTAPGVPVGCRVVHAQDFAPEDNNVDADGHGTNVAAISLGVAPQTSIAALDVFNGNGASTADIIAAINWSIENQAVHNIVAINLSLGVPSSRHNTECGNNWAATPFQNARNAGIIPVVASGNDGFGDGINSPACAPGAVRVGAVYDTNVGSRFWSSCTDATTAADQVACFSNSGNLLTVMAPGSIITAGGVTMSGTSQATPHVAGAIAVVRAVDAFPDEVIAQTVERIMNTGPIINDARNNLNRRRIDVDQALQFTTSLWLPNWGDGNALTGDFNGDGLTDWMRYDNSPLGWVVCLSDGSQFGNCSNWLPNWGNGNALAGDFNGDGLTDWMRFDNSPLGWTVCLSTGSSFGNCNTWLGAGDGNALTGDFNGDGLWDWMRFDNSPLGWTVCLSTGSSFGNCNTWIGAGDGNALTGDFNGDGLWDWMRFDNSPYGWTVCLSTGSQFGNCSTWLGAGDGNALAGDFNGDGLWDWMRFDNSPLGWSVCTSNGSSFGNCGTWLGAGDGHALTGDFNGDGMWDWLRFDNQPLGWVVHLSTGSSF